VCGGDCLQLFRWEVRVRVRVRVRARLFRWEELELLI